VRVPSIQEPEIKILAPGLGAIRIGRDGNGDPVVEIPVTTSVDVGADPGGTPGRSCRPPGGVPALHGENGEGAGVVPRRPPLGGSAEGVAGPMLRLPGGGTHSTTVPRKGRGGAGGALLQMRCTHPQNGEMSRRDSEVSALCRSWAPGGACPRGGGVYTPAAGPGVERMRGGPTEPRRGPGAPPVQDR